MRHHPHPPAQFGRTHLANVHLTQANRALVWRVQAKKQARQGGFSAAGAPEDAQHFAGRQVERNLVQHTVLRGLPGFIAAAVFIRKRNAVKRHRQGGRRGKMRRAAGGARRFNAVRLALDGEQLAHPLQAGAGLLQILHLAANPLQRFRKHAHIIHHQVGRT